MKSDLPSLFITCSSALEPLLQQELLDLGVENTEIGYRGVYVDSWDWATLYKINYCSRLGSRVLLPLNRFKCYDARSLYRGALDIDWTLFIKEKATIAIDANIQHPQIRNSLFGAQVMKDAICDQLRQKRGYRPSVDIQEPDVQLNLFIHNNMATISFDTSGLPLHKRGYRLEGGLAPLQETLAAALLKLANYDPEKILLDPCCGSGTILIEAALMATNTAPGYLRRKWGFMHLPEYKDTDWLRVRNSFDANRIPLKPGHLFGLDIAKEAVRGAKVNLRAAGFLKEIEITQGDFRDYHPPIKPNMVVTNPPYGKRLEDVEYLVSLYRDLGDFLKQEIEKPGHAYVLTGNYELTKEVGLAASKRHVLNNGGLEARLLEFDIY